MTAHLSEPSTMSPAATVTDRPAPKDAEAIEAVPDGDSIAATITEKVVESVDTDAMEEAAQQLAGETLGSHGTFFGTMPALGSGNVGMSPADSAEYADATRRAIRDLYPELIRAPKRIREKPIRATVRRGRALMKRRSI